MDFKRDDRSRGWAELRPDEEESIPQLHQALSAALQAGNRSYEIIVVDDGSNDRSFQLLAERARQDPHFTVIRLRRNFGQTAALMDEAARFLILMALAAVGLNTSIAALLKNGIAPLMLGLTTALVTATLSLGFILALGMGRG